LYNAIDDLLVFLQQQTSLPGTQMVERWPELYTLTLISSYDHFALDLRGMTSARIASKHPLRKLQFSPSIMALAGDDLDWLRDRVDVEMSTTFPELSGQSGVAPFVVHWPDDDV